MAHITPKPMPARELAGFLRELVEQKERAKNIASSDVGAMIIQREIDALQCEIAFLERRHGLPQAVNHDTTK